MYSKLVVTIRHFNASLIFEGRLKPHLQAKVDLAESNKHTSLPKRGVNCHIKKFYCTGPYSLKNFVRLTILTFFQFYDVISKINNQPIFPTNSVNALRVIY